MTNFKAKAIAERIGRLEDAISKAREYLESGAHANWRGFRPLFSVKVRDGVVVPPHRDWVKNVFLRRRERALKKANKLYARLSGQRRRVGDAAATSQ